MTRIEFERVLTLNRVWQPLATLVTRKALTLVFRGRARIVDVATYQLFTWDQWVAEKAVPADAHVLEHEYIRTATLAIQRPVVITLARFAGYPNEGVPFSRRGIYERDNGKCQYCGRFVHKGEMTLDHVVPVCRGGATTWENCVLACGRCNHRKGDRNLGDSGLELAQRPVQPTREQLLLKGVSRNPLWEPFLREVPAAKQTVKS